MDRATCSTNFRGHARGPHAGRTSCTRHVRAGEVLRCRQMGRLVPGGFADLIVLPAQGESAGEALSTCRRHHLRWWCWMDDRVWACRSGLKYSARVASRPLRCVWTESNGSQTRGCSAPSSSACTSRSASVSLTSTNVGRGFSRAEIQVAKRFDRSLDRERPNAHGPGRRGAPPDRLIQQIRHGSCESVESPGSNSGRRVRRPVRDMADAGAYRRGDPCGRGFNPHAASCREDMT